MRGTITYCYALLSLTLLLNGSDAACTRHKRHRKVIARASIIENQQRQSSTQTASPAASANPGIASRITQLIPNKRTLFALTLLSACALTHAVECYGGGEMQINQQLLATSREYGHLIITPVTLFELVRAFKENSQADNDPLIAGIYSMASENTDALKCPFDTQIITGKENTPAKPSTALAYRRR